MSCELPSKLCKEIIDDIADEEQLRNVKISVINGACDGAKFVGEIIRLVISGTKRDGKKHTISLIMKTALQNPEMRLDSFVQLFYKKEVVVYNKMLPALDACQRNLPEDDKFRFAKLYKAVLNEGEELLVMEDLMTKGYRMLDKYVPLGFDELILVIKNLARFHATSIVLKAKYPQIFDELCTFSLKFDETRTVLSHMLTKNIVSIKKLIKGESYETKIGTMLDKVVVDIEKMLNLNLINAHSVLSHGDCWLYNLLFKYEKGKVDNMVFLDWQLMRKTSPILDISYFIMSSMDSKSRCEYYYELLGVYYETLTHNVTKMGVDINMYYSEFVYKEEIKKYMRYGVMMSFGFIPLAYANKEETGGMVSIFKECSGGDNQDLPLSEVSCVKLKEFFEDAIKLKMV